MKGDSLISVIIIFFNAEKYLREAIDSVFAQRYRRWELLLVDDGSADGSTEIASECAARYPKRVKYLAHPGHENRGMSAARNLGIQNAEGEFLAFLDADDVWSERTLEEQQAILEEHPEAAMVFGRLHYWYGWTGYRSDGRRDYVEELGVPPDSLVEPPKLLYLFLQDRAAVPSGLLVRREAIEQYGAFEESFRGEYEDQVFCAKICLHAPVYASSRCWYMYRQHPDSAVANGHQTGATAVARRVFLDWLASYLTAQGVEDRRLWWALTQEYWSYSHPRLFRFIRRNRHRFLRK